MLIKNLNKKNKVKNRSLRIIEKTNKICDYKFTNFIFLVYIAFKYYIIIKIKS